MRAVFFCITSASILTRSVSILTTSSAASGVGVGLGSWIAVRLGRPLFVLMFWLGVCELTELPNEKAIPPITISTTAGRRNNKVGCLSFICLDRSGSSRIGVRIVSKDRLTV